MDDKNTVMFCLEASQFQDGQSRLIITFQLAVIPTHPAIPAFNPTEITVYKPLDSAVLTAADSFREIRYRSPLSNTQPFSESKVVLPRKPPKKAFKINSVHDSLIMTALTVSNNTFRMDGAIGHKVM